MGSNPIWIYFVIPVVSALVGYGTNVVAIWMTFYPVEFWPIKVWQPQGSPVGLFGWQGIIPSKATKITRKLCEAFLEKLFDVEDVFGSLEPSEIATITAEKMQDTIWQVANEVAAKQIPNLWRAMSTSVKSDLISVMSSDSEVYISMLLEELKIKINDVVDIPDLMERLVEKDKDMLNMVFLRVGGRELNFIKLSGIIFGLLFGIIQAVVYVFYDATWVLPVAGFIVGYATNWIALKMIFEPAHEYNVAGLRVQGLFLKRQSEASIEMSKVMSTAFLRQDTLWNEIFFGKNCDAWDSIVADVTARYVDHHISKNGMRRIASALLLSDDRLAEIQTQVATGINKHLPAMLAQTYNYMDDAMKIEKRIRTGLQDMPAPEFIGILRPAFQEDEIKLIAIGGVLGAAAGLIQEFAVFAYL